MIDPLTSIDADEPAHWQRVYERQRPRNWGSLGWVEMYYPYRAYDRALAGYIRGRGYRTFLDIGCGHGPWLIHAARRFGLTPAGLDYSSRACALARANLALAGIDGTVVEGDFTQEIRLGVFDVVYLGGVIEHYEDPRAILRHVMRHVAPGGTLVNWLPTSIDWTTRLWRRFGGGRHFHPVSREAINGWYRDIGLEDIETRYSGSCCLSMVPKEFVLPRPVWLHNALVHYPVRGADALISGALIAAAKAGVTVPEGPRLSPHVIAFGRKPA